MCEDAWSHKAAIWGTRLLRPLRPSGALLALMARSSTAAVLLLALLAARAHGQSTLNNPGFSLDPAAVPADQDPIDSPLTPTTQLPIAERARQATFLDHTHARLPTLPPVLSAGAGPAPAPAPAAFPGFGFAPAPSLEVGGAPGAPSRPALGGTGTLSAPQDAPLKGYTLESTPAPAQYVTLGDAVVMVGPPPGSAMGSGPHASHWLWPLLAIFALGAIVASVAWAYSKRRPAARYHDLHDTEMAMMRRPNP
ncbi:hypothetical protein WJX81_007336 [Elliptochloris bilobata]|uniref:Transmembrane protein n=1 Tax=Elliptochloris bilobata TaxID=381761 RepID=A0AAW1S5S7_9CHLO